MSLYQGSNKVSSQINIAQYTDATELMKYMNVEVGDIGQVALPINENENRRRYLNGQAIIQSQFPKFTNKLKQAVSLYPQLACNEAEWQQIRLNDPDDQCGKFVIDDVAGTIRLPRVKFLCGNLNLYTMLDGIPTNRRLVDKKEPSSSDPSWYNLYSDGWLEQGGYFDCLGTTYDKYTVQLSKNYKDTNYSVFVTLYNEDCGTGIGPYYRDVWNKTVSSFQTFFNVNVERKMWVAYGYAKKPDTSNITLLSDQLSGQFESPYYIQVSTGVEYNTEIINDFTTNSPYSFGMFTHSLSLLNNASWLKSEGNYYSGITYPDFYNWILQNYNGVRNDGIQVGLKDTSYQWTTVKQENLTISDNVWTSKRHPEVGDKVFGSAPQHVVGYVNLVQEDTGKFEFYNYRLDGNYVATFDRVDTDDINKDFAITDYMYLIDTVNQSFRLPLLTGDENVPDYLNVITPELPAPYPSTAASFEYIAPYNGKLCLSLKRLIASTFYIYINNIEYYSGTAESSNIEITLKEGDRIKITTSYTTNAAWNIMIQKFIKSKNNSPLYFYAGETIQNANLINIGRLVENIASIETLSQLGQQLSVLTLRYVTSTWNDGKGGFYTLYNDGWCEQGGVVETTAASGTVQFHQEFKDTKYTVVCQEGASKTYTATNTDTAGYADNMGITNGTTSSFRYSCTKNRHFHWYACGYYM